MSVSALKPIRIDLSAGAALLGAPYISMPLLYTQLAEPFPVSGQVLITQTGAGPASPILVRSVIGELHSFGARPGNRVLLLQGMYDVPLPPPQIGEVTQKFTAVLVADSDWIGHGTFYYGGQVLRNVPVKPAPQA
jgi:hypothetical protein